MKDIHHQMMINRFFLFIEFCLLSLFYFFVLKTKFKKLFFFIFSALYLIYSVQDYTYSKPGEFNFSLLVVECLFFLSVIVYFFYEKILYSISSPIYYSPTFWISVAFLIYFSGNFFLFLFSKSMFKDPDFKSQYTIIYSSVTIIKNIFLGLGIVINSNSISQSNAGTGKFDVDLDTFYPTLNTKHNLQ